jgi:hypothetical protein
VSASPDAGGCRFFADPEVRAGAQTVFWLPEIHAGTVILTSPTPGHSETIRFAPETWAAVVVVRKAPDGSYVLLREGRTEHRLWISEPLSAGELTAAIVPLDESASTRADATVRFWRYLTGRRVHIPLPLSGQRLIRLASSLRALDGRQAGASYRSIATVLFGSTRIASEAWKTASVRDTTIRLVRSGIAMMKDGYRKLLGSRQRE